MADKINRRSFLKAAFAAATAAVLSRKGYAEPEDAIKQDLEHYLGRKIGSLKAERIEVESKKPSYLCDILPEQAGDSTAGGVYTEEAHYFLRDGIKGHVENMADAVYSTAKDPRARLLRKEYTTSGYSREDFIASEMDIDDPRSMIRLTIKHEDGHEDDTKDGYIDRVIGRIRQSRRERERETNFPVNERILLEERAILKELLNSKREYYTLSEILAGTELDGEKENQYGQWAASVILLRLVDKKMAELGKKEGQYHLLKRHQIREAVSAFTEKYHPELISQQN